MEGQMGMDFIARDCHGEILGARCVSQNVRVEPTMAEAMAALHTVQFCKELDLFCGDF
jgi:hypothetical protein